MFYHVLFGLGQILYGVQLVACDVLQAQDNKGVEIKNPVRPWGKRDQWSYKYYAPFCRARMVFSIFSACPLLNSPASLLLMRKSLPSIFTTPNTW